MNPIKGFWHYAKKVYGLHWRLKGVRDDRTQAKIPTEVVSATLFLGMLLRIGAFLQLEQESKRWGFQRLTGYAQIVHDDLLAYVCERYRVEDWRWVLVDVNRQLKKNKGLESAMINGLLVVALDANEQFHSDKRCCEACSQRRIKVKDSKGVEHEHIQYYHRQVYAHIQGPDCSVILDLEPIRPGEDECRAALRLLGRMRRMYGPRFFQVVTVDAWYTKGPFLLAVEKMGWGVVSVLKQEKYHINTMASLLQRRTACQELVEAKRQIKLWDIRHLDFTEEAMGKVRVVIADEKWEQNHRVGGTLQRQEEQSHWRWMATRKLDGYGAAVVWRIGHRRWGVENDAFNELTQHYHLTHCAHHHPVAILVCLLIKVLAFNLFEFYVKLNGKLWRVGRTTLREIARQMDLSMEQWEQLEPIWSG
ncbi:MAG: transposase [Verrucomicrobiae bacterium]|nr:transposase [Verrucomicrobiae bacterium]